MKFFLYIWFLALDASADSNTIRGNAATDRQEKVSVESLGSTVGRRALETCGGVGLCGIGAVCSFNEAKNRDWCLCDEANGYFNRTTYAHNNIIETEQQGFYGCSEANECENQFGTTNVCDIEGGGCEDRSIQDGRYKCFCNSGYVETSVGAHGPELCIRLDTTPNVTTDNTTFNLCETSSDNPCGGKDCIFLPPASYSCECPDGLVESNTGECLDDSQQCDPSRPEVFCIEEERYCDVTIRKCLCKPGFIQPAGAGGQCQPVDECEDNLDIKCDLRGRGTANPRSKCIDDDGRGNPVPGYECECLEGFEDFPNSERGTNCIKSPDPPTPAPVTVAPVTASPAVADPLPVGPSPGPCTGIVCNVVGSSCIAAKRACLCLTPRFIQSRGPIFGCDVACSVNTDCKANFQCLDDNGKRCLACPTGTFRDSASQVGCIASPTTTGETDTDTDATTTLTGTSSSSTTSTSLLPVTVTSDAATVATSTMPMTTTPIPETTIENTAATSTSFTTSTGATITTTLPEANTNIGATSTTTMATTPQSEATISSEQATSTTMVTPQSETSNEVTSATMTTSQSESITSTEATSTSMTTPPPESTTSNEVISTTTTTHQPESTTITETTSTTATTLIPQSTANTEATATTTTTPQPESTTSIEITSTTTTLPPPESTTSNEATTTTTSQPESTTSIEITSTTTTLPPPESTTSNEATTTTTSQPESTTNTETKSATTMAPPPESTTSTEATATITTTPPPESTTSNEATSTTTTTPQPEPTTSTEATSTTEATLTTSLVTSTTTNLPVTTTNGGVPIDIPDSGDDRNFLTDTLSPSMDCLIADINVNVEISHTWIGDLEIIIRNDDTGTSITLFGDGPVGDLNRPCGDVNGLSVTFDDSASDEGISACSPGTFKPSIDSGSGNVVHPLLDTFYGERTAGTWSLLVQDWVNGDAGTLDSWSLDFECIELPSSCSVDTDCPLNAQCDSECVLCPVGEVRAATSNAGCKDLCANRDCDANFQCDSDENCVACPNGQVRDSTSNLGCSSLVFSSTSGNFFIPGTPESVSDTITYDVDCVIASVVVDVAITHCFATNDDMDANLLHVSTGTTSSVTVGDTPDSLDAFIGESSVSGGTWTLSIGDTSGCGDSEWNSWSLDIECEP